MKIRGKTWKFGDNINTDEIIPARYLNTFDADELGRHCMEDVDAEFPKKIADGDVIVGGKNFGCGSSREHAPIAIKGSGISCVIAESFARIFYRNAINTGLPIVVSLEAARDLRSQEEIEVDTVAGTVRNLSRNKIYQADRFPDFMQEIITAGGLLNWIKKKGLFKK